MNKITRTITTTTVSFIPSKKLLRGEYVEDEDVIKMYFPGQLHDRTAEKKARKELARRGIDESLVMIECETSTKTYTMSLDAFIANAICV